MSLGRMRYEVDLAGLSESQKKWWPRHLKAFAEASQQLPAVELAITEDAVIQFLRSRRDAGFPAWQRLEIVRAIQFYQQRVLQRSEPGLDRIRMKLQELTDRERLAIPGQSTATEITDDAMLIGRLDAKLHDRDLASGQGTVWLPFAMAVKAPNAAKRWKWQ